MEVPDFGGKPWTKDEVTRYVMGARRRKLKEWDDEQARLVKVTEAGRTILTKNGKPQCTGYFTEEKWVFGKTPAELERQLGMAEGDYRAGVKIWHITTLPRIDQFDIRAYTHLPDGKPYKPPTDSSQKDYKPGLGANQYTILYPHSLDCELIIALAPGETYSLASKYYPS
ncbi:MAG TPA: hypothetical protein VET85_17885, partial [Stellaceae bacterium]|nr:hypothetical protein [Stellaceae bacterium]